VSKYEIRPFREGDEAGLIDCFNAVFGENDEGFVDRTRAEWDWAFARNPAGRRIWVAENDGQIVAQCAALPYRVDIDGMRHSFTQGVDSMVHPEHRRGLRRPGLFVATARPFFEQYGGLGGDLLHYGWPVEPAWRIGKTFLEYEIIRTQTIHFRDMDPGPSDLPAGVERLERFDDSVEKLYERCRLHWGASTLRDAAYLNWRFAECPRADYDLFGVRDSNGDLLAYAVFRKADWPRAESGLIMDWLCPHDELAAGELLRDALLNRARALRTHVTLGVFPEHSFWFRHFQAWGWSVFPSDYLLIGIVQDPRYDTWWLRDHWWYQLAELDVV